MTPNYNAYKATNLIASQLGRNSEKESASEKNYSSIDIRVPSPAVDNIDAENSSMLSPSK